MYHFFVRSKLHLGHQFLFFFCVVKNTYVWLFFSEVQCTFLLAFRLVAICLQVLVGDYLLSAMKHSRVAGEWEKKRTANCTRATAKVVFFFIRFSGLKNDIEQPKKNYNTTLHAHRSPSEHMFILFSSLILSNCSFEQLWTKSAASEWTTVFRWFFFYGIVSLVIRWRCHCK